MAQETPRFLSLWRRSLCSCWIVQDASSTKLATTYGLAAVGYYLSAASILSLIAFLMIRETKHDDVNNQI